MAARSSSIYRPVTGAARWRAVGLAVALLAIAVAAAPGPAGAKTPRKFFGVSAVDPEPSDFQRMASGRVGTYRLLLNWASIQPEQGRPYDWSGPDAEIAAAARNRLRLLPYVYGSPGFAAPTPQAAPLDSPAARSGWQAFVTEVARRYGPRGEFWRRHPGLRPQPVRVLQVWNEQNASAFWESPSPERYAALLRLTRTAVRRVIPKATIALGGMYGYPKGEASIYAGDYLKQLYQVKGVKREFDAVSVHPYGGTIRLMRYQVKAARRIMNRAGDRKAKILVSEIGWSTDGPPGWPIVTSEQGQAKKLGGAFKMLAKNRLRWGIDRVVWFAWRDFEADICEWCSEAGLITRNGDAKPAWREFTRFTRGS